METPTITASAYTSSAIDHRALFGDIHQGVVAAAGGVANQALRAMAGNNIRVFANQPVQENQPMSARIIKIYIADSNDNLPLEKRVLYTGEEKLTDLTDQELFFEVPIADLLSKHNAVRATTVDKKQAEKFGRDIYLEPARIRDLKMVVVTVAQF